MKITSLFKIAAGAGFGLTLSAMSAIAIEATATVELNVRTGPGTNFGVIDTLAYGERVNTTECVSSGWCYIEQAQQNGWVSSSYLQAVPAPAPAPGAPPPPAGADCQLVLTFGSGRATLERVCTSTAPPPPPPVVAPPPPVGAQACFFRSANYQGANFCYAPGQLNSLNAQFNDHIRSVRLTGNVAVRLCVDNNLGGFCADFTSNTPAVGALLRTRVSSLKVFTPGIAPPPPPPPPVVPVMYKTGGLSIASSFTADFDTGTTGAGGADVWHHAINAAIRRLEPRNGAQIALGNGSNRGFAGCSTAAYSTNPVPFAQLGIGTYVCVRTSQGRISQFRVNSYTGTTMNIGFTTWAN